MKKPPEELYKERHGRYEDAIQLKEPDRVPIVWSDGGSYFPAKYVGMPIKDAFYDEKKWFNANKQVFVDHEPDMCLSPHFFSGRVLDLLGDKTGKWPGSAAGGLGDDDPPQYGDPDGMRADEYDAFIRDPSDFGLRKLLPRMYTALEPLEQVVPLWKLAFGENPTQLLRAFAKPGVADALKALVEAGAESERWVAESELHEEELHELGLPTFGWNVVMPAFDIISSPLRGMEQIAVDIYKQPAKMLEAVEMITPLLVEMALDEVKRSGHRNVYVGTYWGADGFMPLKKFEKLYWPGFNDLISRLLAEDLTVFVMLDGSYSSKMHFLAELPQGKIACFFDIEDIPQAKETLGDTHCIGANLPPSWFQALTAEEVREETKKLIDMGGKNGGFMICTTGLSESADPTLVKTCIDTIKEYGVYKK